MTFGKEPPLETYRTELTRLQDDLNRHLEELSLMITDFPPSRESVAALLNKITGATTVARFNLYTPDERQKQTSEPSYTITSEE